MASATAVRDSVKTRLHIKAVDTTFNDVIDEFVSAAVLSLYPLAALEVGKQTTSVSPDAYGEVEIDLSSLSTPLRAARRVEAYDGSSWRRVRSTFHHKDLLTLRGLNSSETQVRIYGVTSFKTVPDVYDWFLKALYWFAMSEFYDYLAGDKSTYSIYMQQTGARAVDNMSDEAEHFDLKAKAFLEEQKQTYGL